MSDLHNETVDNEPKGGLNALFSRIGTVAAASAFFGLIGLVFALFVDRHLFYTSYLFAYIVFLCFTLGCLGFSLLHHMIRGYWGLALLRIWEAGSRNVWLMAVLFIPIAYGMFNGDLYHWSNAALVAKSEILQKKQFYLNPFWWSVRAVGYFLFWGLVANWMNRSSVKQDETGDERMGVRRQRFAAPAFLIFMLAGTFAFTDWVMSLDDEWYSTMFGLWFAICAGLSAMTLGNFVLGSLAKRKPYNQFWTANLGRDLGNVMLALTMLWAYTSLSQFLIIWSGNLPEEISYYVHRFNGPLLFIGAFLIFFQFFVPFVALLSTRTKRTPDLLARLALWLMFVRLVDMFWTMTPFFRQGLSIADIGGYALDLGALAFVGGAWIFAWTNNLKKAALIPTHDPRLAESYIEAQAHHA